jgi:hypothetical protein
MAAYEPLTELLAQADREGKWLRSTYHDICFTPAELRAANDEGRFRWGPVNWLLVDPQERIDAAKRRLDDAQRDYDAVCRKANRR